MPTIALVVMGLRVMDGPALTLTSAKRRLVTAVCMHSVQTISVHTIARAFMDLRVTDGRALTLTSAQPRFITAVYMHSAQTI